MRNLIRVLTGAALCAALVASAVAPIPENLPAVSFQQAGLYRLEVALLVFHGGLLLITPAFSGLIRGRLPIEISTRGAKFADEADESADATRTAIENLKEITDDLGEELAAANLQIKLMKGIPTSDKTQPEIDSER
jgi:hypothetical protein